LTRAKTREGASQHKRRGILDKRLAKEILDKGENKRRGIAAQENGHP
jgi:hypothetical protein